MATHSTTTLPGTNATDAEFRAQCQFFHDIFALGWVQTADTGQINLTTVTRPLAANTVMGYEMWRMNDALQGTHPVFVKIEYGSGTGAINQFSVWLTIGTGSNGTGTITGTLFARTQITCGNTGAVLNTAFGSAATNRITWAAYLANNATNPCWFSLERRKTSAGADTDTGLILAYGNGNTGHRSQVLPFGATPPAAETGLQFILSTNNPTTYTGDQGIGLLIPMLGIADQPGLNVCVTMQNDFATFAQPTFSLYGALHTWRHCGTFITTLRVPGADANTRLMLLYE
jgi:hypothetical protein